MRKIIKRKKLTESVSMNFSANGDTTNDIMDILHKITNLSKPVPVTQAMMPKAGPMMPMFKTVDAVRDYADSAGDKYADEVDEAPKSDEIGDMIKSPGFGSSNAPQPTPRPPGLGSGSSDSKPSAPSQDTSKPYTPQGKDDTYNGAPEESLGEIMKLAGLKHDHLVDEDEEGSGDASAATAQSSAPAPAPAPEPAAEPKAADLPGGNDGMTPGDVSTANTQNAANTSNNAADATTNAMANNYSNPGASPTPAAPGAADATADAMAKNYSNPGGPSAAADATADAMAKNYSNPGGPPTSAAPGGSSPIPSGPGSAAPNAQAGQPPASNKLEPSAAPAAGAKPEKFSGTIKDFQKANPGASVGQAMNAIQGKTAIAGGANDPNSKGFKGAATIGGVAPAVVPRGGTAATGGAAAAKPAAAPGTAPKPATATGGAPAPKPAAAPGGVKPVSQGGPVPTPPPRPAAAASTAPKPAPAAAPAVTRAVTPATAATPSVPMKSSEGGVKYGNSTAAGFGIGGGQYRTNEDISAFNRIMELSGSKRRMKEQSASLGFNAPIKAMTMPQAAVSTSTDSKSLGNSKSQIDTDQKSGSTPTVTTGNLDTQQPSTALAAPAAASTPAVKPTSEPSGSAELPTMTLGNVGGGGLGAFTSGLMPGTGIQAPNTGDAPPVTWSADALTDPERSGTATAQPLDASGKTGADTPSDSGSSNNQNRSNQGQGNQGGGFNNMLAAVLSGALGGALGGRGGGGYYAQPSRAAYYPQGGAFHPQMPRTVYQPRQIFGGGGGRPSFGGGRGGRREESVGEEFANEPNPKHADIDYMNMMLAGGLNRPKKTFPKVAKGDNPMQAVDEAVLKNLVSSYQKMVNGKDS